ncbi:sulfotransferase 12 [Perilla frutescens var. hirtella]|uniref:Sulfotransferase n=1 Tax=Perilla frutescens var. hirtella TaxID=608512 RepID=A0AAD4JD72_PERFH|nr:sulfotransferase 12 [Perilla frutescens var. hirtella]
MSSQNIPKYLQEEEALSEESKALISSLPRQKGWFNSSHIYLYQGFWYQPNHLQAVISCQKHFQVEDSDVFLVTYPKCGTTWLKAVIFTLLNRKQYPVVAKNHPLLTTNPHDLVLSLEINLYADNQIPAAASFPSRRFFSTHMPYVSLPKNSSSSKSKCKVVYVCRNPKDTFVSLWHFMNKLQLQEDGSIREKFEMFCDGAVGYGPFWDHVLEYWKQSREMNSDRVFFLKYEDMKEKAEVELRRLAEFLDCPFSAEEEESGVVEGILKLTSFESMSSLEVNKVGRLMNGMENRHFFREGVVGDWNNYLSAQMVDKLDRITREKFLGSGLVL